MLWREGAEDFSASESYDGVMERCVERLQAARNPEMTVYQAQAREDAAAAREGRKPRLVATIEDARKIG